MSRDRKVLANSFSPEEVLWATQLFARLLTGMDVTMHVRNPLFVRVSGKFLRMQERADRESAAQRDLGERP